MVAAASVRLFLFILHSLLFRSEHFIAHVWSPCIAKPDNLCQLLLNAFSAFKAWLAIKLLDLDDTVDMFCNGIVHRFIILGHADVYFITLEKIYVILGFCTTILFLFGSYKSAYYSDIVK